MKHAEQTVENGKITHFLTNETHSLCGCFLYANTKITKKKVNCGKCISIVEICKKVKANEHL